MGVDVGVWQPRAGDKVIVHVKDVGQQRLGGLLLEVELLHLVLHHDGLPSDLLPRPRHPQHPGDPLQEQRPHLHNIPASDKARTFY